jgi:hypothetical protein
LKKKELVMFKGRAAELGLTLSRYFAHLARRDMLGENEDLRLYTPSTELMERLLWKARDDLD